MTGISQDDICDEKKDGCNNSQICKTKLKNKNSDPISRLPQTIINNIFSYLPPTLENSILFSLFLIEDNELSNNEKKILKTIFNIKDISKYRYEIKDFLGEDIDELYPPLPKEPRPPKFEHKKNKYKSDNLVDVVPVYFTKEARRAKEADAWDDIYESDLPGYYDMSDTDSEDNRRAEDEWEYYQRELWEYKNGNQEYLEEMSENAYYNRRDRKEKQEDEENQLKYSILQTKEDILNIRNHLLIRMNEQEKELNERMNYKILKFDAFLKSGEQNVKRKNYLDKLIKEKNDDYSQLILEKEAKEQELIKKEKKAKEIDDKFQTRKNIRNKYTSYYDQFDGKNLNNALNNFMPI
jgi:hypothetical protein